MKSFRQVKAELAAKLQAAKDRAAGLTPAMRAKMSMQAAVEAMENAQTVKKKRLEKAKDDGPEYE